MALIGGSQAGDSDVECVGYWNMGYTNENDLDKQGNVLPAGYVNQAFLFDNGEGVVVQKQVLSKTSSIDDSKVDDTFEDNLNTTTNGWKDLTVLGKIKRVVWDWFMRYIVLLLLLYLFVCSIGLLGAAFQLLGGKAVGETFRNNEYMTNPIAGLMFGVLATVLVQSSSTTTSIIVTMTAADILEMQYAVFILMGANIGTSVTNTIVAMSQLSNKGEFERAFAGATIHDMFNWLTVIILLPLEVASGYLLYLSTLIIESTDIRSQKNAKQDILNVITKPFTHLIIQVDKKKINQLAGGAHSRTADTIMKECCKSSTGICYRQCKYMFRGVARVWSDQAVGGVLLVLALILMIGCLVMIVKLLSSILKGKVAKLLRRFLNADFPGKWAFMTGYVAILLGAGVTIVVQSSSIFTSTLTPLVGLGLITVDRMYPLTLGSNIGTTFTGVLAALSVSGGSLKRGLIIALCHLFFNISGIIIWYPVPFMRRIPIRLAKMLGKITSKYRWFAVLYIVAVFFLIPGGVFGLSLAGWKVMTGVLVPIVVVLVIVIVINILQNKRPGCLPGILKTWNFLPLFMHSLEPLDYVITKVTACCRCCKCCKKEESDTDDKLDTPKLDFSPDENKNVTTHC